MASCWPVRSKAGERVKNTDNMKPAFFILTIIHGLESAREAHISHEIPNMRCQIIETINNDEKHLHEEKVEPVVEVDRLTRCTLPTDDIK